MLRERVIVAGIGNIFLGDDGFGAEVARRLSELDLPDWVRVGDYGTSGMHLAYDLTNGADLVILVDAASRGGEPGTVYLIEPDRQPSRQGEPTAQGVTQRGLPEADSPAAAQQPASAVILDGHGMQPDVVLEALDLLGAEVGRVLIVACEPTSVEFGIGLSAPVAGAVEQAVRLVLELIDGQAGRDEGR